MRLFDAGELSSAILAFEAELQLRPDNAEAWRMLGTSHAENDEDKRAIACLERAVEHVSGSPLAMSYHARHACSLES